LLHNLQKDSSSAFSASSVPTPHHEAQVDEDECSDITEDTEALLDLLLTSLAVRAVFL
jgi:hypothetical protein